MINKNEIDLDLVSIEDLLKRAEELAAKKSAPATKISYQKALSAFIRWCQKRGVTSLPATAETIAAYIVYESERGIAVSSLELALSAISQSHKLSGYPSPTSDGRIRDELKGLRRDKGTEQRRANPLMLEQLERIVSQLGPITRDLRDAALLTVGWMCALRRSEIVALRRGDIESVTEGLIVRIRKSKTDQEAKGRSIGIPFGSESFCPVRIIRRWITAASIKDPDEPLFFRLFRGEGEMFLKRKTQRPLNSRSVNMILCRVMELAGYDSAGFSGHSLRAGFCTSAARAGIQEKAIMLHTGHESVKVMHGYIREGTIFTMNPLNTLLLPSLSRSPQARSPLQLTENLETATHQEPISSPQISVDPEVVQGETPSSRETH